LVRQVLKVIWIDLAKEAVRSIYNYYKDKSPQGAKNVRNDLLNAPKTIHFSKQYQVDEISADYRRIVVRDFKILYKEEAETIYIMDVVSSKQSPEKLKKKHSK